MHAAVVCRQAKVGPAGSAGRHVRASRQQWRCYSIRMRHEKREQFNYTDPVYATCIQVLFVWEMI